MTAPERVWLFTSPRSDKYLQHGTWHTLQNETAPAYVPAARLAEAEKRADDAEAELARLREALAEIIEASNNSGIEHGTVGMRVAERVEDIARAALAGG